MVTNVEHFWSKVDKSGECWTWTAYRNANGYGEVRASKKLWLAHRFAWHLEHGEIPDGLNVLHSCDNPPCVRPLHLFLGTQLDNVKDCVQKRRNGTAYGEAKGNAKLTRGSVKKIRELYAKGGVTQRALAKVYGVGKTVIWNVTTRRTWRCVA
jgi:hypothetical protein